MGLTPDELAHNAQVYVSRALARLREWGARERQPDLVLVRPCVARQIALLGGVGLRVLEAGYLESPSVCFLYRGAACCASINLRTGAAVFHYRRGQPAASARL